MNIVLLRRYYNMISEKFEKLSEKKIKVGLNIYENAQRLAYQELLTVLRECM